VDDAEAALAVAKQLHRIADEPLGSGRDAAGRSVYVR
jgi:hypothetical protein